MPIHLPNGIAFIVQACAAWAANAVVAPINTRLAPAEVRFIVEDLQAPVANEPQDCLILYTSGTTGNPKGAINTHANVLVQNVEHHVGAWGLEGSDRFLVTTPLAHRAGIARMMNALGVGGTLVVTEKFDAAEALFLIEREGITVAGLPPTVIRMMLPAVRERPQSCVSLRRVIVSTKAFPAHLMREVAALMPTTQFHAVYGMSEAAGSCASLEIRRASWRGRE